MSVVSRTYPAAVFRLVRSWSLATAIATTLAACSANITRFDSGPSFSLNDGPGVPPPAPGQRQMAGGPVVDPPPGGYAPSGPRADNSIEVASLPPVVPRGPSSPVASAPPRMPAASRAPAPVAAPVSVPAAPATAKGEPIEVQPGDTLYALSRRHHVMVADLMAVNQLTNPNLKPGQRLYLPAEAPARIRPPRPRSDRLVVAQPATAPPSGETYTVKAGESLYGIAARHRVSVLDLQRINAIIDARKVMPGAVLRLPTGARASASVETAAVLQATAPRAAAAVPRTEAPPAEGPTAQAQPAPSGVTVLNAPNRQVAAAEPVTMTDASPPLAQTAGPSKLRWPVKGRIMQGFGPRTDGSHNDGVDIAVPAGTDVLAAEGGVVAYAGNEVKSYGNLVLLRHDNGLVTAYANNDKLLVQRGDRIRRGQPIAKAGVSGGADQPQLHFEVRVNSKPVDPTAHLEKP